MEVHLPEDVKRSIEATVRSGHFASADDALVTAWREFERTTLEQKLAGKDRDGTTVPLLKTSEPLTRAEFDRQLLALGLLSQLPDSASDYDDPDDEPIAIEGESLSETVIRERRSDGRAVGPA